jgi:hypothetical protein
LNVYRAVTGVDPNAPPVSDAGGPYFGHKGVEVQFNGSASDPNRKDVTVAWNFGDVKSPDNTSTLLNPMHTYMRAGTYTVTLTVTDAANLTTTSTTTAEIPNIVPVVAVSGATILQGETYKTVGSFTDADPDMWTSSVTYGDYSPAETLGLASTHTFALVHRYLKAGMHMVTVLVSDDDGGVGMGRAAVICWTPQEGIQGLLLNVLEASDLPAGTVNSLSAKLRASQASLDRGKLSTAKNQLNAFRNELEATEKTGRIAPTLATQLSASADRIEASINVLSRD